MLPSSATRRRTPAALAAGNFRKINQQTAPGAVGDHEFRRWNEVARQRTHEHAQHDRSKGWPRSWRRRWARM